MVHVYFCAKSTGVQVVFLGGVNVKHIFSNISSVLYLWILSWAMFQYVMKSNYDI